MMALPTTADIYNDRLQISSINSNSTPHRTPSRLTAASPYYTYSRTPSTPRPTEKHWTSRLAECFGWMSKVKQQPTSSRRTSFSSMRSPAHRENRYTSTAESKYISARNTVSDQEHQNELVSDAVEYMKKHKAAPSTKL
jgi:hypothetical protein